MIKQSQSKLRAFFISNICDWRPVNSVIFIYYLTRHSIGAVDFKFDKIKKIFKIIDFDRSEQIEYHMETEKWMKSK